MEKLKEGDIPPAHFNALSRFIKSLNLNGEIILIFLSGSSYFGDFNEHSDLDVHIIVNGISYRKRGNTFRDGVEIEYFINPPSRFMQYLDDESASRPVTATMVRNSFLIKRGDDPVIDEILEKVDSVLDTPLPELSEVKKENYKYSIDDLWKDIIDETDPSLRGVNELNLLKICLEVRFLSAGIRVPKLKRTYKVLNSVDPTFVDLFSKALNSLDDLQKLARYTSTLIGGWRPEEWSIIEDLS